MAKYASIDDIRAIEAEMPWSERVQEKTLFQLLTRTATAFGPQSAVTFQIKSGPGTKAETLSWTGLHEKTAQAANLFRELGVHEGDVVAFLLPNCNEAIITLIAAATAGQVNPINPTLRAGQVAAILRESNAKVLVTLAPFPKAEVASLAAEAVALAPNVETVLEVDLKRYLSPPLSWIVPLIRPKVKGTHSAVTRNFNEAIAAQPRALAFEEADEDRITALFHTGGTTGMPKIVQHRTSGALYNGWLANRVIVGKDDVLLCPLPMFHVFAAQPALLACLTSGAHLVMPTPAGYRGEGVMDNFWALVERWKISFIVTVPTAVASLMQRPINADVSSLKYAFCGSAPLPQDLFRRFEEATGVRILEGYGMSETTCLISCNPPDGERKIGSVGYPFPYCDVQILHCDTNGNVVKECGTDEIGEICISCPGVGVGDTYSEPQRYAGLYASERYLRSGDLGRLDADGYLWITGRAKDLIIRGGHNIDPAVIEEALAGHPDVAFVGAIGQPDAHSGAIPCAYVEMIEGASADTKALLEHAAKHIPERAAIPKYLEILEELPKTAVGKIFKPDLRKLAIGRIFSGALETAQLPVEVVEVREDKQRGLIAVLKAQGACSDDEIRAVLGVFSRPWEWSASEE